MDDPAAIVADPELRPRWNAIPPARKLWTYGTDLVALDLADDGTLFCTQHGWNLLPFLLPRCWYHKRYYHKKGQRLAGGTGSTFRVPARDDRARSVDLVVKFSRFAQDVPLFVTKGMEGDVPLEAIESADFNDPFAEFGLVMDLRAGRFGPRSIRLRAMRPLAIYVPATLYAPWRLGRQQSVVRARQAALAAHSHSGGAGTVQADLDMEHDYIVIYDWLHGFDAQQCYEAGWMSEDDLHALTRRVSGELQSKGFQVLDNKPKHYILRPDAQGRLRRDRNGDLLYGLIDFELLQRTVDYDTYLRQLTEAVVMIDH